MQRTKPPFRADHVGSILRSRRRSRRRAPSARRARSPPPSSRRSRIARSRRSSSKQEEIGLQARDRRRIPPLLVAPRFLLGADRLREDHAAARHPVPRRARRGPKAISITGKLDFPADHPMLEHFRFLKAHTKVTPKMCIPAPTVMHFRLPKDGIPKTVYPDIDGFFADLGTDLQEGREGVLRRRLPLSAVRRHRVVLSVLAGRDGRPRASACRWPTTCRRSIRT